eukprot:scaffold126145_cov44-Cyclotella_meneghiniana.AAC.2
MLRAVGMESDTFRSDESSTHPFFSLRRNQYKITPMKSTSTASTATTTLPIAMRLIHFLISMLMMLYALAVCRGSACSSRSTIAASTTMVRHIRLRKARATTTIPNPLQDGIQLEPAPSIKPININKIKARNGLLISNDIDLRHTFRLIDNESALPFWDEFVQVSSNNTEQKTSINTNRSTSFEIYTSPSPTSILQKHILTSLSYRYLIMPTANADKSTTPAASDARTTRARKAAEDAAKATAKEAILGANKEDAQTESMDTEQAPPKETTPAGETAQQMETENTQEESKEDDLSALDELGSGWDDDDLDANDKETAASNNSPPGTAPKETNARDTTTPAPENVQENTTSHIHGINNPSPSGSPQKKKSKKNLFSEISKKSVTVTPAASNTTPAATTTAAKQTRGKRNATAMKENDTPVENPIKSTAPSTTLKSALKNKGKKSATKATAPATPIIPIPEHKHKGVIVEVSVDFKKTIFAQFDGDRCKAMVFAITQLHNNLKIGDPSVWICHGDTLEKDGIGEGGSKVPNNMTLMCNYCIGLNAKIFQSKGTHNNNNDDEEQDNLGTLGGNGTTNNNKKNKRNTTIAYFQIRISTMKDPLLLVSQVSFEWGKFGLYIRKKELQAMETETHFVFYFLYSFGGRVTIMEELNWMLKQAQAKMLQDSNCYEVPMEYMTNTIPEFNLRMNVPKMPRVNTHEKKVQSKYESTKKHFHLEIRKEDKDMFLALITYLKKQGTIKEHWGSHVHCTEVVDYNSTPGDLKRAEKFYYRSMNYNASLTASDMDGFKNLNDAVQITKGEDVLATLTGRECLLSLYKMDNGSPLFAEVHQSFGSSYVQVVYPNCREAEASVTAMMKHPAGYTLNVWKDCGVDEDFIWVFLNKFFEPPLVHSAEDCKWDAVNKCLTTPDELDDDGEELEKQSWFIDVVGKQESTRGGDKKAYAQKKAMFNLDGENSLKTMHEKNDVVDLASDVEEEREVSDLGDDSGNNGVEEEEALQEDGTVDEDNPDAKQSGHTPESVGARFSAREEDDDASAGSEDSSGIMDPLNTGGTASDAGQRQTSPEADASG